MTKTIEELNKEQVEQVRELFREYAKDNYLEEITTNEYQFEDYLDYRDKNEIEEFTQEKLSKGLDRLEIINELFDNYFLYSEQYGIDYHRTEFESEYSEQLEEILGEDYQTYNFINDWENEIVILSGNVDYESVVDNVKLPITILLEDYDSRNSEFGDNSFYNIFYRVDYDNTDDIQELIDMLNDSSLETLLDKQGYSVEQFVQYLVDIYNEKESLLDDDKVFQSIKQEVDNAYNYMALTVCRIMTLKELEHLQQSDKITITTDDTIGYHGFIDGSGSLFEIKLNNDMEFNTRDIEIVIDGNLGYGISEVYGSFLVE